MKLISNFLYLHLLQPVQSEALDKSQLWRKKDILQNNVSQIKHPRTLQQCTVRIYNHYAFCSNITFVQGRHIDIHTQPYND